METGLIEIEIAVTGAMAGALGAWVVVGALPIARTGVGVDPLGAVGVVTGEGDSVGVGPEAVMPVMPACER